jgi:hypothetical protein
MKSLNHQKFIVSLLGMLEVQHQGASKVGSFWGLCRRIWFMIFCFWWFAGTLRLSLTSRSIIPIYAFILTRPSPYVHICVQVSTFLWGYQSHWFRDPPYSSMIWSYLIISAMILFLNKGLGFQFSNLWKHNSIHNPGHNT